RPCLFTLSLHDALPIWQLEGQGNGLLSAAANGISRWLDKPFVIKDYHEHSLGERSDSRSVAYIRCLFQDGTSRWGVGIDSDVARDRKSTRLNSSHVKIS